MGLHIFLRRELTRCSVHTLGRRCGLHVWSCGKKRLPSLKVFYLLNLTKNTIQFHLMETLIYQAHHVKDRNVNNSIQFTHTSITFLQWLLTPSGNRSKAIYKWTLLKIQIRAWSLWLAYEPSSMKIVQSYLCALYLSFHILHHSGPYSLVVPLPPPGTYQHRIQKILDGHSPCTVVLAFSPPL